MRTTFASPSAFPPPKEFEASSVPADNGLWLHDDEGPSPVPPDPRQEDPEQAIGFRQSRSLGGTLQDGKLLSESQILEGQVSIGF